MNKRPKILNNVASKISTTLCLDIDRKRKRKITAAHHHALHAFKHDVAAAAHRLYQVMPQEHADPIIENFFNLSRIGRHKST